MHGKVLFCATVDYHFKAFHLPVLKWFKQCGWEVHVAASGELDLPLADLKFNLPISRSPFHSRNWKAYKQLRSIIRQQDYDLIHCHTPMGGVLARLAAREARKAGTKVIYTAHGFHFCKGAPLQNWLLYYPIEKLLARLTDCLITINNEDFSLAVSRRFNAGRIAHIHGVGVDTDRFQPVSLSEKLRLREDSPYSPDDQLLFCAAEFNRNKNQRVLIEAIARLKDEMPQVKLLLAGEGPMLNECRRLTAELGVAERIHFLGYRADIDKLLPMCDAAVSGSLREGLPVNVMEAMACGLPVVAARNRGHLELIIDQRNGYIANPHDAVDFSARIRLLCESAELRRRMGSESLKLVQKYNLNQVLDELCNIYKLYMGQPKLERMEWSVQ
ncbi:glycosyltransferase family 4 protein [Paenibacillus humicola]|uniref:glycosyltransferase family 4 protein n=1 Tax=Paenibacillus humicola TaxID=3110540 RepID=UPI00237B6335|nr:glycosyltransferase family 4 protein [Paenibacillus humicola]